MTLSKKITANVQSTLDKVRVLRGSIELTTLEIKSLRVTSTDEDLMRRINEQEQIIAIARTKIEDCKLQHDAAPLKIAELEKILRFKTRQLKTLECGKAIKRLLAMRAELDKLIAQEMKAQGEEAINGESNKA